MPNYHDNSYKSFFSDPLMMRELLLHFIDEDWVKEVDFNTLENIKTTFITDDLRDREDDVIWRVCFRDEWVYVYILLEFQSTVGF